jgi:butyryl-CoA dehydrogenase
MARDIAAGRGVGALQGHADALERAWETLVKVTRRLAAATAEDAELGLANASVYLEAFGHVVVAWMWLRQALAAARALEGAAGAEADFYRGKLSACGYFFRWELPKTGPQLALLESLDPTCLAMEPAWF